MIILVQTVLLMYFLFVLFVSSVVQTLCCAATNSSFFGHRRADQRKYFAQLQGQESVKPAHKDILGFITGFPHSDLNASGKA